MALLLSVLQPAHASPTECVVSESSDTALVQGIPAAEYYGQFLFDGITTQEAPPSKTVWHRILSSDSFMEFGNQIRGSGRLYLHHDCSYEYFQEEGPSSKDGYYAFMVEHALRVSGKWVVRGGNLELTGLGSATGVSVQTIDVNGKPIIPNGLLLTFERDLHTPGLTRISNTLIPMWSTRTLDDERASVRP